MSQTIRFATREGMELGRATVDGDTLMCDLPAEGAMRAMRNRVGDVKAFEFFAAGWSNGFAHSNLITDPAEDDEQRAPEVVPDVDGTARG